MITLKQYDSIAHLLPRQRGNVTMNNLDYLNALLYVLENGCKWRALPAALGNWHTVYTRTSRWL
ncbi:MAG: transposase, partial [Eubacteriaceae bacterium]|nr:transposase [Eubacteriaceae bacterium]